MKNLFILIILFLFAHQAIAIVIFSNPITGTNPNTQNPYTTGQTVASGVTASGIGRGTGISGANANNRYNASGWSTGAINLDDYFYFIITPNVGTTINFTDFVYTSQASGTGPTVFSFRTSLDGFATDITNPPVGGATIDLSGALYQNITSAVEFRIYGYTASAGTGTFSVNDFTFNGTVSLPVELVYVKASVEKSESVIRWQTASELNNSHFCIERSGDGANFREIGIVNGAGTSFDFQDYNFTDKNPLPGKNYYRLRQVDFNGNFEFSKVIMVEIDARPTTKLYPSLAADAINLELGSALEEPVELLIFDNMGRLVAKQVIEAGATTVQFPLAGLQAGQYVASLQGLGQVENFRFVKQ